MATASRAKARSSRSACCTACWRSRTPSPRSPASRSRSKTRKLSTSRQESAAELKARALRYLARREHSRAELARKLLPHAESQQLLEGLLSELEGRKLLSNHRFAEMRTHILSRKYGAAKIRHDLKSKGVPDELVDAVSAEDELERAAA